MADDLSRAAAIDFLRQRDQVVRANLADARDANPDHAARAVALSRPLGIPPAAIESDLPYYEGLQKENESQRLLRENPILTKWLENPYNARIVGNDLPKLAGTESLWRGLADLGRAFAGDAVTSVGAGIAGLGEGAAAADRRLEALGDTFMSPLFPNAAANRERMRKGAAFNWEPSKGLIGLGTPIKEAGDSINVPRERRNLADDVAGGVGQILTQIAAVVTTGGASAFALMFGQGVDAMVDDVKKSGKEGTLAADAALLASGAITGLLEKTGIDLILDRVPPAIKSNILRKITDLAIAGGIEATQEAVEQIAQNALANYHLDTNKSLGEGVIESATPAGIAAALVRAMVGAKGRPNTKQPEADAALLGKMLAAVRDTDLATRSPEKMAEFLGGLPGGDSNAYIPVDAVWSFFQTVEPDEAAKLIETLGIGRQLEQALASGGDVVIPLNQYVAHAPEAMVAAWQDEIRLRASGMSRREAREYEAGDEARAKELGASIAKRAEEEIRLDRARNEVVTRVERMMQAAGESPETARQIATLYGERYLARAARSGLSADDAVKAFARSGLDVTSDLFPAPEAVDVPEIADAIAEAQAIVAGEKAAEKAKAKAKTKQSATGEPLAPLTSAAAPTAPAPGTEKPPASNPIKEGINEALAVNTEESKPSIAEASAAATPTAPVPPKRPFAGSVGAPDQDMAIMEAVSKSGDAESLQDAIYAAEDRSKEGPQGPEYDSERWRKVAEYGRALQKFYGLEPAASEPTPAAAPAVVAPPEPAPLETPADSPTIETEVQNASDTQPAQPAGTAGDAAEPGVVEPSGAGVGAGTPGVSPEQQPDPVQEPEPIRRPPRTPAYGGGDSGEPAEPGPRGGDQGDEQPAVHGEGGGVTKPPPVGAGDNQARPDTPAAAGISAAADAIEERSRSNYRITAEDRIGEGTPKEKVRANIEAIRTLKRLEEEAREATAEEKAVLVKYTGWGAFAQDMFLNHKDTFKNERDEFRALVTDEEYEAARTSTLNAHYTSADVISGMWDAIQQFGYTGGLAMEPSSGVGHFIGLIPDAIAARTAWTAVELDPLTAGIAAKLYAGAEVNNQGFETLKRPSNYYDLVISNVPFGDYKISEKPYGSHSIHDFFFVKSLDKVRPGGVVAFVTSRYTMDRQDSSVRALLAKNADLVGAIRLPGGNKGAFAGNAGTQVTTDIIFLRKRAPGEAPFSDINWMETAEIQTPEGPARINQYFADRPEMMLGEMRLQGSMYRANEPVLVGESDGLRQKIAEAAIRMPAGAFGVRELRPPPVMAETAQGKDGAFFEKDGAIYRNTAGVGIAQKLNPEATQRVKKLIGLRDTVNALLAAQIARDDAAAKSLRGDLKKAYDAFVKKYGPINKEVTTVTKRLNKAGEPVVITRHPNLADFDGDPDAPKVAALEVYDAESGKATRAAIQERTVIAPPADRKINGPGDALAAVLDAKGRVDLNEIGIHLGVNTEGEVIARLGDLIYRNPNGREWETADQYLSGDVVRKLEEARSIAKADRSFARNVEALEKVQPPPLTATDIEVQFGAPWVPTEIYETFLKDIGIYGPKVRRMPITGAYKIEKRSVSSDLDAKYGTDRVAGLDVVEAAINNSKIVVRDRIDSETTVVNHEATQQAQIKVDAVRETFSGDREAGIDGWVFQDRDRTELLEGIYNRTFNNLAPRKFDGAHQTFPGMSADLTLRPHQKDAVWRTVQNGNTLFAHVVGAGKTYTMIASGMEQKRLGLITKPAYVVPNHMLEQFSREFIQAYPNARILVASKDEMSRDSRAAFVAKAATNDWDAIVITHDAFGRIPVGPDVQESFIREQIAELERIIEGEAAEGGKKSPTVKELEKAKLKLEERLKKLLNAERKDIGTTFEESGIDHLFVDEAHLFKNLSFATRLQRVKGLAQGNSQRAEDLYMKIRYLEQKRPSRSAVFATGTPVSNTMAELWTMMRYLELDKLRERGLDLFDSWANTFGKIRTTMELGADARSLKEVTSFSKFVNVPELISIYSEIADTRTADMLKLPRPDVLRPDGKAGIEIVKAEPSEEEEAHILSLVKLAESLKGQKPEKGKPNMLSVVTAGRKVATDGRLIGPDFAFNPKGKIALAVDRIHDIYAKGKEPALAQMVFLDLGVPGGKSAAARKPQAEVITAEDDADPSQSEPTRFNLYADLKERLVTKGIPANEIAFIHDADTDEKKAKLFKLVRSGAVRVLVGSSSKMGVGTNVQDRLIAMHHLDAPWKPAEVEQRDGRIVRQGNLNPNVQIYRYITERSFDAFMWQKLDTKSQFIAQVLSGTKGSRHAEDVDSPLPEAAEMKAAASGDPRIMQHADLTRQVRQLQAQKRSFDATAARSQHEIKSLRSQIGLYESAMPDVQADAAKVEDLAGDKFKVDVDGQTLTERKAAGEKILSALIKKGDTWRPVEVVVGKMSGFDMVAEIQQKYESGSTYLSATLKLSGAREYASTSQFVINSKTDPGGLVRRFENILSAIRAEPTRYEERLTTSRATLQKLEATSDAKWPRANELAERSAQLAALTKDMAAKDKPDAEAITTPEDSGQTFNQTVKQAPDGGAVRGNITFTQSPAGEQRSLMRLFRDRNLSTVLHETGHLWLEELRADAAQAYAPQQLKDDWQKVRDWLGVPEGEDITIEQHEKWARGVEAYLMEGKSPSVTLSGVFARFKAWLVSIYKTALWLRVDLNDDMRGVMDRLIATDEAIAEAKTEIGARRLFASADQAGMTEAEFKAYTDSVTRTQDRAEQAVLDKLMSQVRARRTAEWKEEASALRAEVSGMVDSEPAMRAFNYLRGAALPESLAHLEGMPRMRIAREDLAEYGNPVLPKSVPPIDTDKNGSPVADIAEVLGFADGRAMIDALAGFAREQTALKEAGDKRSVRVSRIDAEVERIMAERHGDMLNDGSIEAEALSALHNEARSDVLAAEVRALARQTGKPATPFQMARQWAKRAIAEKAIPEVMDLSAYTRAEAKAARLAEQAMIKGDADEALRRKQEQMIAHALWMEARDAKEEIEAGRKRMDRLAGVRTIKSMDQDYLEKIHALLERFGIKSPSPRAVTESLRAWADTQIAAGIDIAIPENFLDEAWRKNYDKLTVEEFRGLSDSVKQLAHLGRLAKKIEIDGEKREFEETIAEALTTVAATPQRGVSGDDTGLTPLQEKLGRVVSGLRSADASLLKMETLLEWLDGDKTGRGIFSRTVFKRIAAAQGRESDRLKGLTDQLAAIYAKVPQNQRDRWLDVHSLPGLPKPDGTSKWNKTSIISMALNIGNEGNLDKLLRGYKWDEQTLRDTLNQRLTREEWRFVQDIWDLIETQWPDLAAVHRRVNGVEPPKVERIPVPTPFGTLPGGYYKAAYDRNLSIPAEKIGEKQDTAVAVGQIFPSGMTRPSTRAGATHERTGFAAPIRLSLDLIDQQLKDAAHDIEFREAVLDAHKFLNDDRIRQAIREAVGPEYERQFAPWLHNIAHEWQSDRDGLSFVNQFANVARTNVTIVALGFRISTALAQTAGFANSVQRLGVVHMAEGLKTFSLSPVQQTAFVREKSAEMRNRANSLERDMRAAQLKMQGRSGALNDIRRLSFEGIAFMDAAVSIPTWLGAYSRGLKEGMTDDEAIYYGDKMVRDTQGAGAAKDMAAIQRGGPILKLFTMFYSYFNVLYNRQRGIVRDAQEGHWGSAINQSFFLLIAAPLLGAFLTGQGPEEEEEWTTWAVRNTAFGMFAGLPWVRDLSFAASTAVGGKYYGGAKLSPVETFGNNLLHMAKDGVKLASGEEASTGALKNTFNVAGVLTGLPLGQVGQTSQFVWDVMIAGSQQPETLGDWLKGLVFGPERK